MGLGKAIRKQDIYGRPAYLTLGSTGEEYQTKLGGCVSILIKLIILGYAAMQLKRVFFNEIDQVQSYSKVDPNWQPVKIKDAKITLMVSIFDGELHNPTKAYSYEEMRKDMVLVTQEQSWTFDEASQTYKSKSGAKVEGKGCEEADFEGAALQEFM